MQAPLTAMLVSNDAQTLCTIDKTFEEFGVAGDVCLNTPNARKMLAERPVDLLTLDFDLSGAMELMDIYSDGTTKRPAAVIALTRQGSLIKEALNQRVHFILQKPFTPDLMAKTLKAAYGLIVKEKRAAFRYSVKIDAVANVTEGGDKRRLASVIVDDVSLTGLCFRTSKPVFKGTTVSVDFCLPGSGHRLHSIGRVMWSDNGQAGILFESMTHQDSTVLKRWLAAQCPWDAELMPKPPRIPPTGIQTAQPPAR